MAKTNKSKREASASTAYILAGILLAVVTLINMIQVSYLYGNITSINSRTSQTMNSLNTLNAELTQVNNNVLSMMGQIGDQQNVSQEIGIHMQNIGACMGRFEAIGDLPEAAQKRYNYTKVLIKAYQNQLGEMKDTRIAALQEGKGQLSGKVKSDLQALYTQKVYPLQVSSIEMLKATINITSLDAQKKQSSTRTVFIVVEAIMFLVLSAGEIALFFISKYAARARKELEEKEKNLAEVDARLKNTRQKASNMAVTNILTGMKNRYALDNDLADKLENDRFNIAVFDLDNFRSINDTYGYDFGDEYLAAVAEKLKEEFSDIAELYNITGNEFCFVFNRDVTESQAMRYIQDIQNVMSAPYNVLNLTVQLPVSGAVYHYLAGDCLNVNSLLVKLDTTMRMAKMNGGNIVNTVVNM